MPHIHISTGFALVSAVATVGLVGSVLLFIRSIRKDKLDAEAAASRRASYGYSTIRGGVTEADLRERGYITPAHDAIQRTANAAPAYDLRQANAAAYAPPQYYGHSGYVGADPGLAMVEGMLIGEALSEHNHTEVIERDHYVDSSPSYSSDSGASVDSGSYSSSDSYSSGSSDSGFSYSDSGSSYSDSGSSGGFDASW